jgi:hypothetical protein
VVFGEPLGRHGDHARAEVIGILIANRSKRDFRFSRQNADCQSIKHPRILYQHTPESSIRASHFSHRRYWLRYCRTVIPRTVHHWADRPRFPSGSAIVFGSAWSISGPLMRRYFKLKDLNLVHLPSLQWLNYRQWARNRSLRNRRAARPHPNG